MQDAPGPIAELDEEGPFEAEALADALDIGGRRLIAGDDGGGIAGRDIEEAEDEERHHRHHRDGGKNAPCHIAAHGAKAFMPVLLTPQAKGKGPFTTPPTFLRQAW